MDSLSLEEVIKETINCFKESLSIDAEGLLKTILYTNLDSIDEKLCPELYDLIDDIIYSEVSISKTLYHKIDEIYEVSLKSESESSNWLILKLLKDLYKPDLKDVVYFIKNSLGRVKIGFTCNLKERLSTLRNSSGDDLEVLLTYSPKSQTVAQLEARLHSHYKKFRVMGEWFTLSPCLEEFESICKKLDS